MNRNLLLALALASTFGLSNTSAYADDDKKEKPKPELIADGHEKEKPKPELAA